MGCDGPEKLSSDVVDGAGTSNLLATHDLDVVHEFDAVHRNPHGGHGAHFKPRVGLQQASRRAAVQHSHRQLAAEHSKHALGWQRRMSHLAHGWSQDTGVLTTSS